MPNFVAALAPASNFLGGPSGTETTGALNSGAGADRFVALLVSAYSSGSTDNAITGATYGGVAMTADTERNTSGDFSGHTRHRLFVLPAAPSGSNTFAISWTASTSVRLEWAAVAYDGVSSISAIVFPNSSGTYNAAPTVTISSATGDTALALFAWPADQRATPNGGGVERVDGNADASAGSLYIMDEAGAASIAVDATAAGNCAGWYAWGLSLQAAAAAPVITGPLAGGGRTHSTLTQGRLAS